MNIVISWEGPIPFDETSKFVSDETDFGIYQIHGEAASENTSRLLYIGRAQGGSFGWRIPQHKGWIVERGIRNPVVYLGRLCGKETPSNEVWNNEIRLAELLLIFAHKPPNNERINFGISAVEVEKVSITNTGKIGSIHPELSGKAWVNMEAFSALPAYSTTRRILD